MPTSPTAEPAAAGGETPAVPAPKPLALRWRAPGEVKVGKPFTLSVEGDLEPGLRGLNIKLQAPPGRLKLVEAKEGELWQQGGAKASLSSSADESTGALNTGVLRNEATPAKGSGRLFEWTLVAPQPGRIEVNMVRASPVALDATRPTVAMPGALTLEVVP